MKKLKMHVVHVQAGWLLPHPTHISAPSAVISGDRQRMNNESLYKKVQCMWLSELDMVMS